MEKTWGALKCVLNGQGLVTDDGVHFVMSLSRIGTESAADVITELGLTFMVGGMCLGRSDFSTFTFLLWEV
jgi:hypothetical protein